MKSMRQHLLWFFIPLTLVPLAIVTIWSSGTNLVFGSDGTGFGWTGQAARAFTEVFRQADFYGEIRIGQMINAHKGNRAPLLLANEALLIASAGETPAVHRGEKIQDLSLEGLTMDGEAADFHANGSRLFFVTHHAADGLRFLLLREFDEKYLAHLNAIMGTELTLYREGAPVMTTWRSRAGDLTPPALTQVLRDALERDEAAPVVQTKDVVTVKDYQGLAATDMVGGEFQRRYGVGESEISAYHSVLRIRARDGRTLALLDIAAPASAVLDGPLYAFAGGVVIFVILAVFSVLVVRRVASAYSRPLTATAREIDAVMQSIAATMPKGPETEALATHSSRLPHEIAILESASNRLKHLVEAWDSAQKELAHSRKQLVQSAKMSALGEMAGGVAHEINNPLAVIYSRARHIQRVLVATPPRPEQAMEFARIIETTADRIGNIVKGLKTFARSGEKDPFDAVCLTEVVSDTLALCAERFKLEGVEVRVSAISREHMIVGRAVQISQVLLNLLSNAFDAICHDTEKWIRVEVEDRGASLRVRVTDSGKGIPAAVRDKVMQPFFTTKELGKGTGLGLSVSKGIVEEHGGTLWVDSQCDHTSFVMDLPSLKNETKAA